MTETKKFIKSRAIMGIETLWFENITLPRATIQPILEIVSQDSGVPYAYFSANTQEELKFSISKLEDTGILYLASHGRKGEFSLGNDYISLGELGILLKNKLTRRAVHLSSCETLNTDDKEIENFKIITKASLVSGYTKEVDWLESSAMDIIYLAYLQKYKNNLDKFVVDFTNDYSCLIDMNGLKIYV